MDEQPPPVPPTAIAPSKISGLAIASLVLGVLGLTRIVLFIPVIGSSMERVIAIGAILAPILGIFALCQINRSSGRLIGKKQAVWGIALSAVSLILLTIFITIGPRDGRARAAVCISNVKSISLACAMYAHTHDGRLPQKLDSLTNILTTTKIFICPSAKDKTHYSYAFTGVTNKWCDGSNVVILREIEANHRGKRTLLFNDGHVEQRKD